MTTANVRPLLLAGATASLGSQLTLEGSGQPRRCGRRRACTGPCSEQPARTIHPGRSNAESPQTNCWLRQSRDPGVAEALPVGPWRLSDANATRE